MFLNLFAAHVFGQPWLIIILLSFTLCFFVTSYTVDDSCRNHNGNDISGDIFRAIVEIEDIATHGFRKILSPGSRSDNLMNALFGQNRPRHFDFALLLGRFIHISPNEPFVFICDDLTVHLVPDDVSPQPHRDPRGVWEDPSHGWYNRYDDYAPCDPARRPGATPILTNAFGVAHFIYICPRVLDDPKGRSLQRYKDQMLDGAWIDEYMLLPTVILHELLHTHLALLNDKQVRDSPSVDDIENLAVNTRDPAYIDALPMRFAYGFLLCYKLAVESPNRTIQNCDSVATAALGLYLDKNDWADPTARGYARPYAD